MDKSTAEKIGALQMLEQNLQRFMIQRQTFQVQLAEVENACEELDKSNGDCYKIIGNVMILCEKNGLKKDLESKKEVISLKMKSLERQENNIKEKVSGLQADVMKILEKEKNE